MSDLSAHSSITLDSTGFQDGINQARSSLGTLMDTVQSSFYGLSQVGLGLKQLGDSILGTVTGAVSTATGLESATARLETQTFNLSESQGQNKAAAEAQSASLRKLAQDLAQPINKFLDLSATVASFGYRGEDINKVTKAVTELAADTNTKAADIVTPFARLTDQFGLTADQTTNLASALANVSTHVVGGANAIILMATRSSELAKAFGLSNQETLALTASLADIDGRTRGAATTVGAFAALQQVATGATQKQAGAVQGLAAVMHESSDQVKQDFETNALGAIQKFLQGIAELANTGDKRLIPVLQEIGIKGQQQIQGVVALAVANDRQSTTGKGLADTLGLVSQGYSNTGALTERFGATLDTAAAKHQQFQDALVNLQNSMASGFLPALKTVTEFLTKVIDTISSIPTPILLAGTAFIALVGIIATLGGAFILLGSRVLIGIQAWQRIQLAQQNAANSATATAATISGANDDIIASTEEMAAAVQVSDEAVIKANEMVIGSWEAEMEQLNLTAAVHEEVVTSIAGGNATLINSNNELAVSEAEVHNQNRQTSGAFAALPGIIGAATIALTAITIGMQINAAETNNAKKATQEFQQQLDKKYGSSSLDDITKKIGDLETHIKSVQEKAKGGQNSFLGIDFTLPQTFGDFAADVIGAKTPTQKTAAKEVVDLQNEVKKLQEELKNVQKVAQDFGITTDEAYARAKKAGVDLSGNIKDIEAKLKEAAGAATGAGSAFNAETQATDNMANAAVRAAKEQLTVAQAADRVTSAEEQYRTALRAVRDESEKVTEAQTKLAEAHTQVALANLNLLTAQETAAFAARDQQQKLIDAQNAVVDAQNRIFDSTNAVTKAQRDLQDLNGPQYYLDLQKAVNGVADAHNTLVNDQHKAADAQWYLNYLIQEGASPADIAKARQALTEANQKVTDTTTNLSEAQLKLNQMPEDHATKVASAQIALTNARIAAQKATEDLTRREEDLQKAQFVSQNNIDVIRANLDLESARNRVKDATYGVVAAQETLNKLQDGSVERQLRQAQDAVTQALYAEAEAQTQLAVDTAIANGQTVSAQDQARILAQHLIDVGTQAGALGGPLVAAGNAIMSHVALPANEAAQQLANMNAEIQANVNSFQAFSQKFGAAAGAGLFGQPGEPGFMGANLTGFARGGLVSRDMLAVLHAPEIVLPMDDLNQAWNILSSSGLAASLMGHARPAQVTGVPYAATTYNQSAGGTFNLTAITSADPSEIIDQYLWESRLSMRK